MKKNPQWKVLLRWLLERGDSGLTVLDIIITNKEGHNLAASYRQIIMNLRRKRFAADEAIITKSPTVDGQVHTTYYLNPAYRRATISLLHYGVTIRVEPGVQMKLIS